MISFEWESDAGMNIFCYLSTSASHQMASKGMRLERPSPKLLNNKISSFPPLLDFRVNLWAVNACFSLTFNVSLPGSSCSLLLGRSTFDVRWLIPFDFFAFIVQIWVWFFCYLSEFSFVIWVFEDIPIPIFWFVLSFESFQQQPRWSRRTSKLPSLCILCFRISSSDSESG